MFKQRGSADWEHFYEVWGYPKMGGGGGGGAGGVHDLQDPTLDLPHLSDKYLTLLVSYYLRFVLPPNQVPALEFGQIKFLFPYNVILVIIS